MTLDRGGQEGLPLYLLTRHHLQSAPTGCKEGPVGQHFSSQGPTHLLLASPNEAHLAWPFIPAWAQGWLTLSPSPLPGFAKSSPPCYWKGFQELKARFIQRVHHRSGESWGGVGWCREVPLSREPRQKEAGRTRQWMCVRASQGPPAQPRGPQPQGTCPLEHPSSSIFVFTSLVSQLQIQPLVCLVNIILLKPLVHLQCTPTDSPP